VIVSRAAAVFASAAYWTFGLAFLLFSQLGDVDATGSLSPVEVQEALSARQRNGVILLCTEIGIYALLFLVLRRISHRRIH
jgi:hypothetical protein